MGKYTMMGASAVDTTSSYDNSGINPNPVNDSSSTTSASDSLVQNDVPTPTLPAAGSSEPVDTSDIPNTPDNIAQGQKESSYAMLIAAVAIAFIFLRKKKK